MSGGIPKDDNSYSQSKNSTGRFTIEPIYYINVIIANVILLQINIIQDVIRKVSTFLKLPLNNLKLPSNT